MQCLSKVAVQQDTQQGKKVDQMRDELSHSDGGQVELIDLLGMEDSAPSERKESQEWDGVEWVTSSTMTQEAATAVGTTDAEDSVLIEDLLALEIGPSCPTESSQPSSTGAKKVNVVKQNADCRTQIDTVSTNALQNQRESMKGSSAYSKGKLSNEDILALFNRQ